MSWVTVEPDHTVTHTLGRTPLDEGSARRRGLYLHNIHSREENIHAPGQIRTRNPSKLLGRRPTPQTTRPPGSACALLWLINANTLTLSDNNIIIRLCCPLVVSQCNSHECHRQGLQNPTKGMATLEPEPTKHCKLTFVWVYTVGTCGYRQPFCPLQRHSNPIRTAASIWPDYRLETNSHCLRQIVGGDNISSRFGFSIAADMRSKVFHSYFLIWSLSWLLSCVVSGSNVAVA